MGSRPVRESNADGGSKPGRSREEAGEAGRSPEEPRGARRSRRRRH